MVARTRQRGRFRSLGRFVALVLAMSVSAGILASIAVVYGDRIISAVLPSTTSAGEGADAGETDVDGEVISSASLPRDCAPVADPSSEPIAEGDPALVLLELSRRLYPCADKVIVAADTTAARLTGARLAIDDEAAFLVAGPAVQSQVLDELRRLAPEEVAAVGFAPETAALPAGDWELTEVPADPTAPPFDVPSSGDALWVLHGDDPDLAALLSPAAAQVDAGILLVSPTAERVSSDPFAVPAEDASRLRAAGSVELIGPHTATERWVYETLRSGAELPGGGLQILPDGSRPEKRYIAFYGAPGTSLLGVLGEQDPSATLERMRPLLAEYETDDGAIVVPTFELITTVAASEAGDDGDYSNETPVEALRPYVDYAADNGVYVLLDLQPGRTDFLTQAKLYEELLIQPHVGLALDPEWRLAPDQVHLRQLGSVDAAEVNEVAAWLAEIVRDHALPQKMLLIHQFNQSMVKNRAAIEERPELSVVIQMDGQGPLGSKYGTLAALIRGEEDGPWRWGWKNFYDEDTPMATPAQTLAVDPQPVYVSYQ